MPAARSRSWTAVRAVLLTAFALGAPIDATREWAAADVPPELKAKITVAIEKGEAWLRSLRSDDGTFSESALRTADYDPVTAAALGSQSLLNGSGSRKADPVLEAAAKALKTLDDKDVKRGWRSPYSSAIQLMFAVGLYRDASAPGKPPSGGGSPGSVSTCAFPVDLLPWVRELTAWLTARQHEDGSWSDSSTTPGDASNTQFALLGLRAARDCGEQVPTLLFMKALKRVLATQDKEGPDVRRAVSGGEKSGGHDSTIAADQARGFRDFGKLGESNVSSGAMTAAGLVSLVICRDALVNPERLASYTDDLDQQVVRAIHDGFAWLDRNFAVDKDPPLGLPAWHHMYLCNLEQACDLAGVGAIGSHDWYSEGAKFLIEHQRADGSWNSYGSKKIGVERRSDLGDTARALLFLKKATRPLRSPPPR